MSSIGEIIREARIAKNLTAKELGKILGLNEEVIINYESDKIKLDLEKLLAIIDILDINFEDVASLIDIDTSQYKQLRDYENNKREEFYKKYSDKVIAEKRTKSINSQGSLKELAEVLNEVLVGRLNEIYNERENIFKQGDYEEIKFRDYNVFERRYYYEIKEMFFEEINNNIKNTIEDYFENIELYMRRYFNEQKNNEIMRRKLKLIETCVMIKEIFKHNKIKWAILELNYIMEENIFNNLTVIIDVKQKKMALAILDLIALKIDETIYKLNNIKFRVTTEANINGEVYNLNKYKIKYFLIEDERIPGLIKKSN